MKKFFILILAILLLGATSLVFFSTFDQATAKIDLDDVEIFVVLHVNDELEPEVIHSMLNELGVVTGIQICVWVGDNTTDAIWDSKGRLEIWMEEFTDYKVVIQCDYAFNDVYGVYRYPFWIYENTETMSQEWYTNWFGNLTEVVNRYPNVVLMTGFNEPYNHFATKEMAQTIMKREYLTWKSMSNISFSTEFLMPRLFWAEYWGFPENLTIEEDLVPYWRDYSDYIGVNLWAYNRPPQYGSSPGAYERAIETVELCNYYSEELGKPIHVNEFPAWSNDVFKYTVEELCIYPNIGQVYQLWYWSDSEEMHYDGWTYGLYNVDIETHIATRAKPSWEVFDEVLIP